MLVVFVVLLTLVIRCPFFLPGREVGDGRPRDALVSPDRRSRPLRELPGRVSRRQEGSSRPWSDLGVESAQFLRLGLWRRENGQPVSARRPQAVGPRLPLLGCPRWPEQISERFARGGRCCDALLVHGFTVSFETPIIFPNVWHFLSFNLTLFLSQCVKFSCYLWYLHC